MVGKLLKYEMNFYSKIIFPFLLIMPITALLSRIVLIFKPPVDGYLYENENHELVMAFYALYYATFFMFCVAAILCFLMTNITAVVRFYTNLFSAQGYLTMTLPVSATTHVFVKLLAAVIWTAVTGVVFVGSLCVLSAGDYLVEIVKAIVYMFKDVFINEPVDSILFVIELSLFVLISPISAFLSYYFCIAIGQMAKKARILFAFIAYFVYYLIMQFVSMLFAILEILGIGIFQYIDESLSAFELSSSFAMHLRLDSSLLLSIVLSVAFFIGTVVIMKKKLNLE
ncbi:MAG: hypothetical protein IJ408_02960 [Clostridia bacterium]|nr:hypothetical protein [Clostridia bacterium]